MLAVGHMYGSEIDLHDVGSFFNSNYYIMANLMEGEPNHDVVIRMNNAPTKGFEHMVGEKTTLRLAYQCCGSFNKTVLENDIRTHEAQIALINYGKRGV